MPVWVLRHVFSLSPAVVFVQGWAQVHCPTPLFHGLKTVQELVIMFISEQFWLSENSRAQISLCLNFFTKIQTLLNSGDTNPPGGCNPSKGGGFSAGKLTQPKSALRLWGTHYICICQGCVGRFFPMAYYSMPVWFMLSATCHFYD